MQAQSTKDINTGKLHFAKTNCSCWINPLTAGLVAVTVMKNILTLLVNSD